MSLTAFEAAWLRMLVDTTASEAVDTLDGLPAPPRRVKDDPYAAWDRIVQKIAAVAPRPDPEEQ